MLRKDFIIRQIEEFGKVLALIIGFKKQNEWTKFEEEIKNAIQKFTSLEMNEIENLNIDFFVSEIINREGLSLDQKKIIANLMYEKLYFYLFKNENENYSQLKAKCLLLYLHLNENCTTNEFDLDVHYKLSMLQKQIP
jgi:hypothetical protein